MNNNFDLLIFTKAPKSYESTRTLEEASKKGLNAMIVSYPRIDFRIAKDKITILYEDKESMPVGKYVIFRAAGGDGYYIPQRDFLLDFYKKLGSKVLNDRTYMRWPRLDKITQHFEMQKGGLPFIDSMNYGGNKGFREQINKFPVIAKHDLSSQGKAVFKLKSAEDVEKFLEEYRVRTVLVQEFLTVGEDLRVIVIGGKAIGAMKRIAQNGSHLTNYSQGGLVEAYDLENDPKAKEIAEKTANHFLCDYVGVDLMMDNEGSYKVLEVNRSCQFQGFESVTGISVPEKVIEFFK
jgi:gamma-F420-2:alpha-L-glutamate ligase